MVSIEYANAYSEVLEILKFISKEDYEKIPNSKIELFETNQNKEYIFEYNPNKTLEEQKKSMYDVENIFKKRSYENDIKENEREKEMLVYKETFFRKYINKIKSLFKIK